MNKRIHFPILAPTIIDDDACAESSGMGGNQRLARGKNTFYLPLYRPSGGLWAIYAGHIARVSPRSEKRQEGLEKGGKDPGTCWYDQDPPLPSPKTPPVFREEGWESLGAERGREEVRCCSSSKDYGSSLAFLIP